MMKLTYNTSCTDHPSGVIYSYAVALNGEVLASGAADSERSINRKLRRAIRRIVRATTQ